MSKRTWVAGTGIEQLDDLIEEHVNDAVKYLLSEEADTSIFLPMEYFPGDGGPLDEHSNEKPPPDDALTVRVLCEGWKDGYLHRDISLTDELCDAMAQCRKDGSYHIGLERIGRAMLAIGTELIAAAAAGRELEIIA